MERPLAKVAETTCESCGRELTSPLSRDRQRGEACYMAHLEKRVEALEQQVVMQGAAIKVLDKIVKALRKKQPKQ